MLLGGLSFSFRYVSSYAKTLHAFDLIRQLLGRSEKCNASSFSSAWVCNRGGFAFVMFHGTFL